MVDSLATTGSVTLSKRYVLSKGMLVEAQTGLVKDAVDSLSAAGKYLIFITTGSASKVQDSFGADFMYHVMDTVTTKALDEASVKMLIDKETDALITKAQENLRIRMNVLPPVKHWVKDHYDKTGGAMYMNQNLNRIFMSFFTAPARRSNPSAACSGPSTELMIQGKSQKAPKANGNTPRTYPDILPCEVNV